MFDRVAFPGYRAVFAGEPVPIGTTDNGLIMIQLPAGGRTGALVLSYVPPGQSLGLAAAMVSLIALLIGTLMWPRLFGVPDPRRARA